MRNFQQICFSSGLCFFCCLNHEKCERSSSALMCSNPLTPDSPTNGAVTSISKGQTSIMLPLSINDPCLHKGGCSLLWRALVLSLPCPKVTAGAGGLAAVRDKTPSLRICLEKITKQKNCQPVSVCSLLRPGSSVIWILQSSIKVELPCSPILLYLIHAFLLITADSLGNRRPCCSLFYALGKALVALLDDQ